MGTDPPAGATEGVGALALLFLILGLESSNKRHEYLYYKCKAKVLFICVQAPRLYFIPLTSLM